MAKVLDSYNEVGFIRPLINKYRRIGFNPSYWHYRANWWLVDKLHYITDFPIHMDIESTNYCNLKCIMCPHSLDNFNMQKGIFDFELYKQIIRECGNRGLKSLKLNIRGEPLLNRNLPEMVGLAKEQGILEVMFNTNGILLTPEKTRSLAEAGLDYLIISIDGASPDTYNRIRPGADYNLLKSNIEYFLDYRRKGNLRKPLIRLQYVAMEENKHEVPLYIETWRDKVDVMTVNRYSDRGCGSDKRAFAWKPVGRANCYHPWRRLSVMWNGDAQMCCGDWQNLCVIGNVKNQSVYEIWHSEKFNGYRKKLKSLKLNEIPCCADCFVLASYVWEKDTASNSNANTGAD